MQVKQLDLIDIYQDGFNSFMNGLDSDAPYPQFSLQWSSWTRGWNTAKMATRFSNLNLDDLTCLSSHERERRCDEHEFLTSHKCANSTPL